jgi:L,D-transpeptidase YcbB
LRLLYFVLASACAVAIPAVVWLQPPGAPKPLAGPESETATGALPEPAAPSPPSPELVELRQRLPTLLAKAPRDEAAVVTAFYETRHALLWLGEAGFTPRGQAVAAEIRKADDWGLRARDFDVPAVASGEVPLIAVATEAEVAMTLAVLKYARHARGGRIRDPSRISKILDHTPPLLPPQRVLEDIAASDAPDAYLRSLHPQHEQFGKLQKLLVKLRHPEAAEGAIAMGANLPQTEALPWSEDATERKRKPQRAGAGADIDRILVNMERWRWLPRDLGTFHVWNNVPEFLTRVVQAGKIVISDRIVAGQPAWPTPSFSADMKTIVFHPSWGVPDGIKRKELGPLLRKSSGGGLMGLFTGAPSSQAVLDGHNLDVYYKGRRIDPNQVDWSSANISTFEFRQPPGPKNVLGTVKFLFPNKHDVYMHDTPERDLFAREFRGLSHGCMRVGDPRRMAEVLLQEDKGWSKEKVASLYRAGTRTVALSKHIPVHNTYFTAMVDYKGNLRTFGDLYGIDARVGKALLKRSVRFKTRRYDPTPAASRQRQPTAQAGAPQSLADVLNNIFSP